MTENINNYQFNFTDEVARIRTKKILGRALLKAMIFSEAELIPEGAGVKVLLSNMIKDRKRLWAPWYDREIARQYNTNISCSSMQPLAGTRLVLCRTDEPLVQRFGPDQKQLMRLFVIYHETGHALIPGKGERFRECAADAYAALRLLQRFGDDAIPLLSMLSWHRARNAVDGGVFSHLTSPVLDKIIADNEECDFAGLSPQQTVGLAVQYAQDWMPTADMISAVDKLPPRKAEPAALLAGASRNPHNAFLSYLAAKIVGPYAQPGGFTLNDRVRGLWKNEHLHYDALQQRQAGKTLRSIFGGVAPRVEIGEDPPLAEAARIILPPGQGSFTYRCRP
jgi:hypothetical protein